MKRLYLGPYPDKPNILDQFDLDPDHSIVEIEVPAAFHNKTIAELQLRSHFGLTVLAIGKSKSLRLILDRKNVSV